MGDDYSWTYSWTCGRCGVAVPAGKVHICGSSTGDPPVYQQSVPSQGSQVAQDIEAIRGKVELLQSSVLALQGALSAIREQYDIMNQLLGEIKEAAERQRPVWGSKLRKEA